jgi:hypothetical protein
MLFILAVFNNEHTSLMYKIACRILKDQQPKPAEVHAKEKMIEALFEYAAACHVDYILDENPVKEDSSREFTLPPEFDKKMKKMIARHERKESLKTLRKKTIKYLPKAAIFLLVLIGSSFTIVVASVEALRVKASYLHSI